jgi:hypothetical protein
MLYYAITVKDGIITAKHESAKKITAATFKGTSYNGQKVITVPADAKIQAGLNVREYNEAWELKPLSQRVADGYITIEPGFILDGETIRPMTAQERIDCGLDIAPDPEETAREAETGRILKRIDVLKCVLNDTDYRVIKCYEYSLIGSSPPYDIQQLHQDRQAARDEINALETELERI